MGLDMGSPGISGTETYQLSTDTGNTKTSKRVFATPVPCYGGGKVKISGACECPTNNFAKVCRIDFGDAMAPMGTVYLTWDPSTQRWANYAVSPTVCFINKIEFFCAPSNHQFVLVFYRYDSGGAFIEAGGYSLGSSTNNTQDCDGLIQYFEPNPFPFLACGLGDWSATVTIPVDGSNLPPNQYAVAVDTGNTKGGKKVFAAVDCRDSPGVRSGYRIAKDTGGRKNGKRVFAAESDPCCDGGANPFIVLCSNDGKKLPKFLTLTVEGTTVPEGPYTMVYLGGPPDWVGDVWEWRFPNDVIGSCLFNPGTSPGGGFPSWARLVRGCGGGFTFSLEDAFNYRTPNLFYSGDSDSPLFKQFGYTGGPSFVYPYTCGDPIKFIVTE